MLGLLNYNERELYPRDSVGYLYSCYALAFYRLISYVLQTRSRVYLLYGDLDSLNSVILLYIHVDVCLAMLYILTYACIPGGIYWWGCAI